MNYISFDPGEDNFAIRIEKRVSSSLDTRKCTSVKTLVQDKYSISFEDNNDFWLLHLYRILDSYAEYYPTIDIALVETQMHINTRMKCMEAAIFAYYLLRYPAIVVVDISPKLKSKMLSNKKMNHAELKKWSPQVAVKLTKLRRDDKYFECMADRDEMHHDADTLVQIEAFCAYVGYCTTI